MRSGPSPRSRPGACVAADVAPRPHQSDGATGVPRLGERGRLSSNPRQRRPVGDVARARRPLSRLGMGTAHGLARSGTRSVSAHRPPPASDERSVVELRHYRLHSRARETLIDLFDREFVETQEPVGIAVIGQFRDLDDADSFVWLRGFRDMPSRAKALAAFYGDPVWGRHREDANRTMINSDNVLLLRLARQGSGFALPERRPDVHARTLPPGLVIATVRG